MNFANPTYLWALSGILIPVIIHLLSKKEGKVIRVGSIQLLKTSNPRQSRHIRINEVLLLMLRILIIAVVVLIMAKPVIPARAKKNKVLYLIEPELYTSTLYSWDSIPEDAIRILDTGFPEPDDFDIEIANKGIDYWSLANETSYLPADSIVAIISGKSNNLQGKRPVLPTPVQWIVLNPCEPKASLIKAVKKEKNISVFTLISDCDGSEIKQQTLPLDDESLVFNKSGDSIRFKSDNTHWTAIEASKPFTVLFKSDAGFKTDSIYLEALLAASGKYLETTVETLKLASVKSEIESRSANLLVWLSDSVPPSTHIPTIRFKADTLAKTLLLPGNTSTQWELTAHLNAENIFDNEFSEALIAILNFSPETDQIIEANDLRTFSAEEIQVKTNPGTKNKNRVAHMKTNRWLWLVLCIALIAERITAYLRKQ